MVRLPASAAMALVMLVLSAWAGSESGGSSARAEQSIEKTVPQGEDPPGADGEQPTTPPTERNGVITPPPIGDEDIYTDVPNPEAGHDKEVIPPPGSPEGNSNIQPR